MKLWKPTLIAMLSVLVLSSAHGQTPPSPVSAAATALAMKSLAAIERSWVIPSALKGPSDCVMLGRDRGGSGDWRVVVLAGGDRPRVAWDSQRLQLGGYLKATSSDGITVRNAQDEGYLITIRGCAPHRCYDGLFGYAVYVSKLRRAFIAHVETRLSSKGNFDYAVTYDPQAGVPAEYRSALQRMICADPGISEPAKLPVTCPGR